MKPTALVIEDDDSYRLLLRIQLQRLGFSVVHAVDGWTGVTLASLHTPAVIVTDFVVPRMSGYEVWQSVQKDAQLRHIPLLIVSAHVDGRWGNHGYQDLHTFYAESLREGSALGLYEKGQSFDELAAALRQLLGALPIDAQAPNNRPLGDTVLVNVPEYSADTTQARFEEWVQPLL